MCVLHPQKVELLTETNKKKMLLKKLQHFSLLIYFKKNVE